MSGVDEFIGVQDVASELGVSYSVVYSWTTNGVKAINPGDTIHTRVCLKIALVGKRFKTTRRWLAEFLAKADRNKLGIAIHLGQFPNVENS